VGRNRTKDLDAFLMWDKAHVDGQLVEVNGLKNRRSAERTLYLA
jgi:GH24 family phage-related lysozyme (muramidase)